MHKHRTTISAYRVICEHVAATSDKLGGIDENGNLKVVEIDESLFLKRKYNRGRLTNGQWYIGGIESGTKKTFIVPVSNRNAQTIIRVIIENVHPNTKIITDQWKAYETAFKNLDEYLHLSVNHSLNFINPLSQNIHTETIEGFWSQSKTIIRSKIESLKNNTLKC